MVKLEHNLTAVRSLSSLHKLGLAACLIAVALVTGHIFQHVVEGTSSTLINCRVCSSLASCAASEPVHLDEPTGEFSLFNEVTQERPAVPQASPNSSRAPPISL